MLGHDTIILCLVSQRRSISFNYTININSVVELLGGSCLLDEPLADGSIPGPSQIPLTSVN